MSKDKVYFAAYFLLFPLTFLFSSFVWRYVVKAKGLAEVMTDSLAILAIYYFIVSILFVGRIKQTRE